MNVLAVRVGGAEFGIDAERVREVLRPPGLTRVPFPPPDVLGVAQVRGTVMAVLDLGTRLAVGPAAEPGLLVVVWTRAREATGLVVDELVGMVDAGGELSPPPEEAEAALPPGWLAGIIEPEPGRRVALLDLERVLGQEAR